MNVIQEKLKLLPDDPGVYIMNDRDGNVIYVGKARNLKNRVRQYFHASVKTEKVMAMVQNVTDFHYIITKSEIDEMCIRDRRRLRRVYRGHRRKYGGGAQRHLQGYGFLRHQNRRN